MAGRKLSMRKIKEILRLKWQNGCSDAQIAGSCKIARSTVREYLRRAQEAGLTWPLEPDLDDRHLENLLFPVRQADSCAERRMPSMQYLFDELSLAIWRLDRFAPMRVNSTFQGLLLTKSVQISGI